MVLIRIGSLHYDKARTWLKGFIYHSTKTLLGLKGNLVTEMLTQLVHGHSQAKMVDNLTEA